MCDFEDNGMHGILWDGHATNTRSLFCWVKFLIAHLLNELGISRVPWLITQPMLCCLQCYYLHLPCIVITEFFLYLKMRSSEEDDFVPFGPQRRRNLRNSSAKRRTVQFHWKKWFEAKWEPISEHLLCVKPRVRGNGCRQEECSYRTNTKFSLSFSCPAPYCPQLCLYFCLGSPASLHLSQLFYSLALLLHHSSIPPGRWPWIHLWVFLIP